VPNQKGDVFISIPSPPLRQAIRRAAYETNQPIRRIVWDILTKGLAEIGYPVEPALTTDQAKEAVKTNTEQAARGASIGTMSGVR